MKQLTLHIPDEKYTFFLELVQSLRFVKVAGEKEINEKKPEERANKPKKPSE